MLERTAIETTQNQTQKKWSDIPSRFPYFAGQKQVTGSTSVRGENIKQRHDNEGHLECVHHTSQKTNKTEVILSV